MYLFSSAGRDVGGESSFRLSFALYVCLSLRVCILFWLVLDSKVVRYNFMIEPATLRGRLDSSFV